MLLRSKMRRLPPVHQAILRAILEHLSRVIAHSERNKMDAKNLAIVFGGVIFGEDEMPKGGEGLLSVQTWKVAVPYSTLIVSILKCLIQDTLMEDLITNTHVLYEDQTGHPSPPLPPTPLGEPARYYYGSKTTKVASVPPTITGSAGSPTQDFTPRLPPRPANSIHPSSRGNPVSPTRGQFDNTYTTQESFVRDNHHPPSPSLGSVSIQPDVSPSTIYEGQSLSDEESEIDIFPTFSIQSSHTVNTPRPEEIISSPTHDEVAPPDN